MGGVVIGNNGISHPAGSVFNPDTGTWYIPGGTGSTPASLTTTNETTTHVNANGNPVTTSTSTSPNVPNPDIAAQTAAQLAIAQGNNATTAAGNQLQAGSAHEATQAQLLASQGATQAQLEAAGISAETARQALAAQVAKNASDAAYQSGQLELATQTENFSESQAVAKAAQAKALADQIAGLGLGPSDGTSVGALGALAGGTVAPDGPDPSDTAFQTAQTAALTGAKERGGENLAASLKSLRGLMAERGISDSGIEAADTADLYGQNLKDQASVEGDLASSASTRAASVADRNFAAKLDLEKTQAAAAQQAQTTKLQALLSLYGMAY